MPMRKLTQELDARGVKYVTIRHSCAYTAQEVAASAHVPGRELAKTVMVDLDGQLAMVVVRAVDQVDLESVRDCAGARQAALATERQLAERIQDGEVGAMPPFGNLFGVQVFVDDTLREHQEIAFNAGTHTELVRLAYRDFEDVVRPTIGQFAKPPARLAS